ncbi:hypothetical protein LZC95_12710 [Pendulispora brunnea]|uniref:Cytochrome c-552/4 domain-containing protein n=1 Tax=Pendulispora brunnea TaxID=2905690 RepID=A0ABZ2KGI3_9BACT
MAICIGGVAACQGCRTTSATGSAVAPEPASPTLRIYIVSDLAGALEPCGCVKDQLGGMDHFAAWIASERSKAPNSVLVSAGPLFFLDPVLKDDKRTQDVAKATTIASSLAGLGLAGFAPGKNDFVAGPSELERFRNETKGAILMANVGGEGVKPAWRGPVVREINGVKLGLLGVSMPDRAEGGSPAGITVSAPIDHVRADVTSLRAQGAQVIVALAAVGRGEAKRIADSVPELTAIVVGSPGGSGDVNVETPPAERIGNVLIAETGNHLTTAAALDLYVRDGSFSFADGTGLDLARKRTEIMRRIDELRGKIAQWEGDKKVARADIEARRGDLAVLEKERAELEKAPTPAKGSFFRYRVQEVRDSLGKDVAVTEKMLAYYKQVNEENKKAFANKAPRPAPKGEPSYVGIETCTSCHDDARKVWDKTAHAHAYATLANQFKEYNLDCVSCHVTGYDLPGGSTVTHVKDLKDVQCEVCHGAGSKHVASPAKVKMPIERPSAESCLACHHPPHVHEFDAARKMEDILGPGHGR